MATCQLQPGHHVVRWPTENDDSESAGEATWRQQYPGSGDRGGVEVLGPPKTDVSYRNSSKHLAGFAIGAAVKILCWRDHGSHGPSGTWKLGPKGEKNKKIILSRLRISPGTECLLWACRPVFCWSEGEMPSTVTRANRKLIMPCICFALRLRELTEAELVRHRSLYR